MSAEPSASHELSARDAALTSLAASAAGNIPGVDYASITVHEADHTLYTAAATHPLAEQVEQLSSTVQTRTDIGTAVGILMERYSVNRHQAFAFLTHNAEVRNTTIRDLARHVIDGSLEPPPPAPSFLPEFLAAARKILDPDGDELSLSGEARTPLLRGCGNLTAP